MSTNNPPPAPLVSRTQQALARDTISTTWEVLAQTFYPATGVLTSRTNRYVELGAGLNYLSNPATGQWAPSEDLIELMPDGSAAALKGPTKLYLNPNVNSPGAVRIVSADGAVFQSQPIGLFWYDPVSGNASLIARAQDCAGELEPPNQVVYRGAFGDVGDLRLTYTKGAIESDLVLLACPQLPPGFDPATARLELWHACQPTSAPKITPHLVGAQATTDDVLEFGGLWFLTGAAYWSDGSVVRAADTPATVCVPRLTEDGTLAPVCKTWLPGAAEDVLVEALPWSAVVPKLASLPPTAPAYLSTPEQGRASWLAELEATRGPSSTAPAVISRGRGYQPVGLVWDYITVSGSGPYTFNTGETYYVNWSCYFLTSLTFNPCVIKFNSQTYLLTCGGITCNGNSSSPTILTSWQDDLFGTQIQTNQPCPTYAASYELYVYHPLSNVSVTGMRFRWANTALVIASPYPYAGSVSGCSFEFCGVGITARECDVTVSGSTRCSVTTPTNTELGGTLTGSLTDVCSGGVDSDGNHVADLYEYQYFGRLGTLPGNLLGQLINMTNPPNGFLPGPSSEGGSQEIWTTLGHANSNYVYNTNCWLYGARGVQNQSVGISALSPWNDGNPYNPQWGGGTLITPRHVITTAEWGCHPGTHYRFIGKDGSCNEVTINACTNLSTGAMVVLFDNDVTNTVAYVKVLPDDVRQYLLPTMQYDHRTPGACHYVQCVDTDQFEWAYINDMNFLQGGYANFGPSQWFPRWGSYRSWNYQSTCSSSCDGFTGDGGHPLFLLINGELVLLGPNYGCCICPWPGYSCDEINAAIAALGNSNGYTVTPYNPAASGFPTLW
jgi:hypothetical protein